MGMPIIIILALLSTLLVSCIIVLILHIIKFRKYEEKYNNIWSKFENDDFEKDIEKLLQNMLETKQASEEATKTLEVVEQTMLKSLQKIGFVKYDAYEGGNNGLSFSLAILNAKEDGVLINSIYNRNGSNIYAKQIVGGSFQGNLSKEEEKALQIAKNSKSFM